MNENPRAVNNFGVKSTPSPADSVPNPRRRVPDRSHLAVQVEGEIS